MVLWAVLSNLYRPVSAGAISIVARHSGTRALSPTRVLIAAAFLLLGGLFGMGVTHTKRETWLVNQLVAFAPARLDSEELEQDFDKAVIDATANNKPLFVDFTGVLCVNCRLMEIRMAKPKNHRRLERYVQVQVYTDKIPKIIGRNRNTYAFLIVTCHCKSTGLAT